MLSGLAWLAWRFCRPTLVGWIAYIPFVVGKVKYAKFSRKQEFVAVYAFFSRFCFLISATNLPQCYTDYFLTSRYVKMPQLGDLPSHPTAKMAAPVGPEDCTLSFGAGVETNRVVEAYGVWNLITFQF